ncbi:MAG TPA: hypothetical protein VM369_01575 [Candidatus Binatia bacterium]|nr:hypothetical protein [Candidatus Binatia bacterium]
MRTLRLSLALLVPTFAACQTGDDAAPLPPPHLGQDFPATQFLEFFNHQYSLPGGDYRLVVAPAASGTGSFDALATLDDGSVSEFSGSWTGAASADPADADDPSQALTLQRPGGIALALTASSAACVFLLDRTGAVVARAGDTDGTTDACDTGATAADGALPASKTDDIDYARAFYATIDPCNQRTTLGAWKAANGFGADDEHAIFRDARDLGYGRDMHLRHTADGGLAFYVRNYQVRDVPGAAYGPLNLDAALAGAAKYHVGTNAIEWGPVYEAADVDGTCDDAVDVNSDGVIDTKDFFTRHYTFEPGEDGARRLLVNLDGKGAKAMPQPCIVCHGGRADPLLPDPQNANPLSRFPRFGDTKARLQPFQVGTFDFGPSSPWTRADQEDVLRTLNQAVYDSYANYDGRRDPGTGPYAYPPAGEWDSQQARLMMESWYAGTTPAGNTPDVAGGPLADVAWDDSYVPAGWTVPGGAPADAAEFYTRVIAADCRTCHVLRGIGNFHNDDIDFTRYDKFIGHSDQVEGFVFDKGIMPLAYLPFSRFWDEGGAQAMADFLAGNADFLALDPDAAFTHLDADLRVVAPGAPVAKAGPDRTAPGFATVSGAASLFALNHHWEIESGPDGGTLDSADTIRTMLSGPDGTYVLKLTVDDGRGRDSSDTVTVVLDAAADDPRALTFDADIKPIFTSYGCVGCHYPPPESATPGLCDAVYLRPPVFWRDPQAGDCPATLNRDVYTDFRGRVDFMDPENSRVLRKPSGHHHGGGNVFGSTSDPGYQTVKEWILEGAREN